MPRGKPSPKVAITMDADVYKASVTAARAEGLSLSAWLTNAAREALHIRDGLAAIAEWEKEHGAFSEAEMRRADARVKAQIVGKRR